MPVIRYPNFSDLTADISLDKFYLLVGNEDGRELQKVSLRDYLGDIRRYLSQPGSWTGRGNSLLAPRDFTCPGQRPGRFLASTPTRPGRIQPGDLQLPVLPGRSCSADDRRHPRRYQRHGDR